MEKVPLFVDTNWLIERLKDSKLRLLDARVRTKGGHDVTSGKEDYRKGHIPGAVFADMLKEFSDQESMYPFTIPSRERFIQKISDLGVGGDVYVVIYDLGTRIDNPILASHWASRLAWQLHYEGFSNVAVLDGGFQNWIEKGLPVTTEPGTYPKAEFIGERRPELLATLEDVKNAINDKNTLLINSLSEAQFNGEINTYGRSGHIPGSVNVFFGEHTNPETKVLYNDEKLRNTFEKVAALDPNKKVIAYCGSGIAATWNALLLNKLGQKNVAVYDGSLTEWAADPSLPLVKVEK